MDSVQKTLRDAAKPTFERIRKDLERSPAAVQPLLLYIEKNLFHPDLDANQLKRACGIRDNCIPLHFHNVLRLPPYGYIMDCRMEVACRLLRNSRLKLWQIAQNLGFSTLQVFSRAFLRWAGCRPSAYRRHGEAAFKRDPNALRASLERLNIEIPPDIADLPMPVVSISKGTEEDEMEAAAAEMPLALAVGGEDLAIGKTVDVRALEEAERRCAAEEVWPAVRDLPLEQARQTLRCYSFQTAAPFDVLREKALVEGRQDRQRGVEWSRMALASLDSVEGTLGASLHEQRALGWAGVGNARRLVADFYGAERAFVRAYRELSRLPAASSSPVVRGQVYASEGSLRMLQRRLDEAFELLGEAAEIFEEAGDDRWLIQALGQRSSCHIFSGQLVGAVRDLERVLELLQSAGDARLLAGAMLNLTDVHVRAGNFNEARACLEQSRNHYCEGSVDRSTSASILWAEANVEHGSRAVRAAVDKYLMAREIYQDLGDRFHDALVSLDLAILMSEEGRDVDVAQIASETIPILVEYHLGEETRESLRLFQESATRLAVNEAALHQLRSSLRQDPLSQLQLKSAPT